MQMIIYKSVSQSGFNRFSYFLIFFFGSFFITINSFSQGEGFNVNKTYPTPDVANLENFGLIPANSFNGQADVSIPLYTVNYKELQVPITMMYSTEGYKIDDHPGWLGLGWTLNAGGAIYRKVNGIYDEHPKETPTVQYNFEAISYYYNCGKIATNFNNLDAIKKYAFDGTTSSEVVNNAYDALPDEFIFNFNGYSGAFFITRPYDNGPVEIKVRPNGSYKLKAEILEIKNSITFNDWINTTDNLFKTRTTSRNIYKIKITDDKGIQYIFGGTDNSIEFSNNGDLSWSFYSIASAWHLTEIISPNGYKIQFNYKRAGRVFAQQKQRNALFYSYSYNFGTNTLFLFKSETGNISYSGSLENIFISVLNPVYLTSISTPIQNISFTSSKTNELDYPFDIQKLNQLTYPDYRWGANLRYWQKLDEINVEGVKKFNFSYRNESDKRLRLEALLLKTTMSQMVSSYSFTYNSMLLPPYNSKKADHWGYYNGRSYGYDDNYLITREPDANFLQAEMLQTIIYPTGGYLKLEYEPHYYRKVVKQFPFEVEDKGSNIMAGGLRVKKITTASSENDVPMAKELFYVTDYLNGGTISSGVLSGNPQYTNTGSRRTSYHTGHWWLSSTWGDFSIYYGKVIDNNFLLLSNTNGNHVTYSEVTEKSGEGFITYKYRNHDNGYLDAEPYITHTNFDSKWHEEGFISKQHMRGLRQSIVYFDKNKNIVKEIVYDYTPEGTETNYKVPYFYRIYDESMGLPLSRVSTCEYNTKPILLKEQIETIYSQGGGQPVVAKTTFNYTNLDHFLPINKLTISSTGETIKTVYKYPTDFSTTPPYNTMVEKNMISSVIEQTTYKNDVNFLSSTKTNYNYWTGNSWDINNNAGLILPQNVQTKTLNQSSYETRFNYISYDAKANVVTDSRQNDVQHSYIWGYNKAYPIAEAINAKSNEIFFDSFEEFAGWSGVTGTAYGDAPISAYDASTIHTGRYSARVEKLTSGEKYCHSDKTLSISLTQSTQFKYSGWIYSNGPSADIYLFMKRAGESFYYSYIDYVQTTTTNQWVYVEKTFTVPADVTQLNIRLDNNGGGTVWFDDIRLHPAASFMTTFTYDPLIGVTSQSDANNRTTYYEYDGFGRLNLVRDKDRRIIKKICYNYQGQPEDCSVGCTNFTANWLNTTTPVRCKTDANGQNTGEQEQEQRDMNSCSVTYNQTRWIVIGTNTTACPLPSSCNTGNCSGEGYKCVNGICEYGFKIYTYSNYDEFSGTYLCIYHYEWSDGTWSEDYSEYSSYPCMFQ